MGGNRLRLASIVSVVMATIVVILSAVPMSVMAPKKGSDGGSGGDPQMFFSGTVLDWNFKPLKAMVVATYTLTLTDQHNNPYSHTERDWVTTDDAGGFTLPLLFAFTYIDYELIIGATSNGYWQERRIERLPSSSLTIYLPWDQEARVPYLAQFANCPAASIKMPDTWTNLYSVDTYNVVEPYPTAGSVTGGQVTADGHSMVFSTQYYSTGQYTVTSYDSSGKLVYGDYVHGTPSIDWAYTYGKRYDTDGNPFSYQYSYGDADYASPSDNLDGAIYRSLAPGEVWSDSLLVDSDDKTVIKGDMSRFIVLKIGGGPFPVFSTVSLAPGAVISVPIGEDYTVSFTVVGPSDGTHTFCLWIDGMIVHIWQVS